MRKYIAKRGLNEKGENLLILFMKYLETKDEIVKESLVYTMSTKYGYKGDVFKFKTVEEFEKHLNEDTKYMQQISDILENTRVFVNDILNTDKLKIVTSVDARSHSVILTKRIGMNKTKAMELFGSTWVCPLYRDSKEASFFVDKYLRTKVEKYLDGKKIPKVSITVTPKVYFSEKGFWNFDVNFSIKDENLTDTILNKVADVIEGLNELV